MAVSLAGCLPKTTRTTSSSRPSSLRTKPRPRRRRRIPRRRSAARRPAVDGGKPYSFTPQAIRRRRRFPRVHDRRTSPPGPRSTPRPARSPARPPTRTSATPTTSRSRVSDGRDTRSVGPFKIKIKPRNQPPPANSPPTISGAPANRGDDQPGLQLPADRERPEQATRCASRFPTARRGRASALDRPPERHADARRTSARTRTSSSGERRPGERRAAGVLDPGARRPRIAADDQRLAGRQRDARGSAYSFTPSRRDADGNPLTYSIANKPAWATFSTSNGRLSGTPATSNVGNYANIIIWSATAARRPSLPAFAINVQAPPNRAPTISGTPPHQRDCRHGVFVHAERGRRRQRHARLHDPEQAELGERSIPRPAA